MIATASVSMHSSRLLISTFQTIEIIEKSSIVHIEAYENYCKIYTNYGEKYLATSSFGSTVLQLTSSEFFHCHKSYAVSFRHIKRVHKSGDIELTTGMKVPLARRRKDLFYSQLGEWCR